jgi:parallel beta-helix repeat protein
LISKNFFNKWNGGSAELICIKSSGNIIEDNLINEGYGGFSIRTGDNNVVQRNYMINSTPSCLATRTSGYGNIIQNNVFDLHPTCVAWGLTAKNPKVGGYAGMMISTYPAKKNYFRWNKVKNAGWIMWLLNKGSDQAWMHSPLLLDDIPTDNELRLNTFINIPNAVLFHNDLASDSGWTQDLIKDRNTIGSDNQALRH